MCVLKNNKNLGVGGELNSNVILVPSEDQRNKDVQALSRHCHVMYIAYFSQTQKGEFVLNG